MKLSNGSKMPHVCKSRCRAFTLIELLVVLVVIGIVLSIAVPSLLSGRSQRVLVASSSRFYTDLQWAIGEAQKSGNNFYLAFKWDFDQDELLGHRDDLGNASDRSSFDRQADTWFGNSFYPPDNPGVRRVATGYYIIKEAPRFWSVPAQPGNAPITELPAEGTPYTYLDFLNELDKHQNDPSYPAPLEPQYPFSLSRTREVGGQVSGPFVNRNSVPKLFYPLKMSTNSTYAQAFIGDQFASGDITFFSNPELQANKVFCVADAEEILLYDRVDPNPNDGVRTYEPNEDHPRLNDQIYDYVLVRDVDLPEGIYLINPWKNLYPVALDRSDYADFQFIQFIYRIGSDGSFRLYEWTYSPEPFPDGSNGVNAGLVHGTLQLRLSSPEFFYFFFTTEEVVSPEDHYDIKDTRRAQMRDFGRVITVWPLNSRLVADPYAPNDSNAPIIPEDLEDLPLSTGSGRNYHWRFLDKPENAQYPYIGYY